MPKIKSLSVKGFRAFGKVEQTLNVPCDLCAVWASNSKGKSSLAEAVEFLLTGRIVRRELMASSSDEFADALRNAHLANGEEVYVNARIKARDGTEYEVKRVLTSDYGKKQDCQSELHINGVKASKSDLKKLGIVLLETPLEAPVLAQHTLNYLFSLRPQDRATYFKVLLEVTDLDNVRNEVASLTDELKSSDNMLLKKFDKCADLPALKVGLDTVADREGFLRKFENIARELISSEGKPVPEGINNQLQALKEILDNRRGKTFHVRGFDRKGTMGWSPPPDEIWRSLEKYNEERRKIDEETRRLVALFEEALKLPVISEMTAAVDCPLCETASGLTAERVEVIRRDVEKTKDFTTAEEAAKASLINLSSSVEGLQRATRGAMPEYLKMRIGERRKSGFSVARIQHLLGEDRLVLVEPWLKEVRRLGRAWRTLNCKGKKVKSLLEKTNLAGQVEAGELKAKFEDLELSHKNLLEALGFSKIHEDDIRTALNAALDTKGDTEGWQEFLDIAKEHENLRKSLIDRQARAMVAAELTTALKEIDDAKEEVLDDKFGDYSSLIQKWWERLRPDEATFFSAVKPRKGAKRTIDLKVGLSANADKSHAKVRDAIAIFSQSQLHCLGLAMFLARAERERVTFAVLDDPVLSSDEDYRSHFNSTVVSELLKLPMQIIILTQVHSTWKELEVLYRHTGVANAQLFIETAAEGSVIDNTSDALLSMLARAKSLAHSGHPDVLKSCGLYLRDAGERFCKEMLVKDRKAKGEASACLSDYDQKLLGWLCPYVEPLLIKDAADQGKLEMFRNTVNRACHDNAPPGNEEMKVAHGNLLRFVKDYLDR